MNQIAFDIVKDKVIEDKQKEVTDFQEAQNSDKPIKVNLREESKDKEEEDIFGEEDSEEERIIQREIEKRRAFAEMQVEDIEEKKKKKDKFPYGEYREIEEGVFLNTMLKNKRVVCHFFLDEFERCKIMDKHLKLIAEKHPETLFCKINARKSPFFVTRLQVKTLPTIIFSEEGKVNERVVGFEELGNEDDFPTINLVRRLVRSGMIDPRSKQEKGEFNVRRKNSDSDNSD